MTKDEIITLVTIEEEHEEQVEGVVTAIVQIIFNDAVIASFSTSVSWAEEIGINANEVLVSRRLYKQDSKLLSTVRSKRQLMSIFSHLVPKNNVVSLLCMYIIKTDFSMITAFFLRIFQ